MRVLSLVASHHTAPLDLRERLAFAEEEISEALVALRREMAREAVIITTCNRTELYLTPADEELTADHLRQWLARRRDVPLSDSHVRSMGDPATVAHHLFSVAAGIDSQVIGDIQILGQVRDAYETARTQGSAGKVLSRLFSSALHAGKRVRSETDLGAGAVSISYVAVELARKIFHPLSSQRALVVGAGDTGELAARNLHEQGVRTIAIANRTPERAHTLVERLGFGTYLPMEQLGERLREFDIVIVSTGAREYLVTYEMAAASAERRGGRPQLIVDISVPRNVDPRINAIPLVFCKDINDLNGVIEVNVERRRAEVPKAERIVEEEVERFMAWHRLLPVTPTIAELKRRGEEIAHAELQRNRNRFSQHDYENVEKLVGSVVKRLLDLPLAHLLDAEQHPEHTMMKAEYIRLLFNLDAVNGGSGEAGGEGQPE